MIVEWNEVEEKLVRLPVKQQAICWLLARGFSQQRAADQVGLTQPRISQLLNDPENIAFQEAVDSLTKYLNKMGAAESLRLVRRAIAQFEDEDGKLDLSSTTLLQWLKRKDELEGTSEDATKVRVVFDEPATMDELIKRYT